MKDRELRKELKEVGLLYKSNNCRSSYEWREYISEIAKNGFFFKGLPDEVSKLDRDVREVKTLLYTLFELLNVEYVPEHEVKPVLKKGNKSVQISD